MLLAGLTLAASLLFAADSTGPEAPPETLSPERQAVLTEMRQRGVVEAGADSWSPAQEALLEKIRQTESPQVFEFLKNETGTLRGYAYLWREGRFEWKMWLTQAGYERYLFLRSQKARKYFEDQYTDVRHIFQIRTSKGEKIFDSGGLLTDAGENIYARILNKEQVHWIDPMGRRITNVPFRSIENGK